MDLWASISLGEKWIDDDGHIHEEEKVQQGVMITTLNTPIKKKGFLKAMSEAFDKVMELNDLIDKHGQ